MQVDPRVGRRLYLAAASAVGPPPRPEAFAWKASLILISDRGALYSLSLRHRKIRLRRHRFQRRQPIRAGASPRAPRFPPQPLRRQTAAIAEDAGVVPAPYIARTGPATSKLQYHNRRLMDNSLRLRIRPPRSEAERQPRRYGAARTGDGLAEQRRRLNATHGPHLRVQ